MRERLSLAAGALVLVASLLVPILVDYVTSVRPLQPGNVVWRFGAAGLLSGFLLLPLLGLALLTVLAAFSERVLPHVAPSVRAKTADGRDAHDAGPRPASPPERRRRAGVLSFRRYSTRPCWSA